MATVDFIRIQKQYDGQDRPAVRDLFLKVIDGELLVMLGPSGCGKTTALRMIAGLEEPDYGDIQLDGRSVVGLEPKDRDIALVFQQYALYPHLSVRDNMLYPLKVRKTPATERKSRVEQVAGMLGLGKLLSRKPGQLSGGEQQRVALGRAIVRKPKVFLMDEPLSNLDAKLRDQTRTEIKALQRELATTMFFVTHDQAEAMVLADRIAVMNFGELQQVGTPDDIYGFPTNLFVAQFIGSPPMNLFPVERNGDHMTGPGGWQIPAPEALKHTTASENLTLGLRPEAILLTLTPSQAVDEQAARVYLTEPLGSEVIINVRIGEKVLKVRSAPEIRPAPGDTVWLRPDPRGIRLFDTDTGQAIA
ncbi:MAG: ABC transporter ATP-binding protein [Thermomicrobiales bacterium]